jgi:hypothetical protein
MLFFLFAYMVLLLHPRYSYLLDRSAASLVRCTFRDAYTTTMLSLRRPMSCLPWRVAVGVRPQPRREALRHDAPAPSGGSEDAQVDRHAEEFIQRFYARRGALPPRLTTPATPPTAPTSPAAGARRMPKPD